MFMRMKKITIALAAALAVLSACEKTPALPVVQFDKTNYILPSDEPLTVKVVSDAQLTDDVTFILSGTAVKDVDYSVSSEVFSFNGTTEAEITITTLYNIEEKNIILELAGKAGSYTVGTASKTTVATTPQGKVVCSFAETEYVMGLDAITVSVKLTDPETTKAFKAESAIKIPFAVEGTAVAGTDYEVVGGENFFVAEKDATVAKVEIKSLHASLPATVPTLKIKLMEDNPRFLVGVNKVADITFFDVTKSLASISGKWAFSSYPIKDDPETDGWLFEMLFFTETGDTWENTPYKNTASDIVEIKNDGDVYKISLSGNGNIHDYLVDADVLGAKPHPYKWYFYSTVEKPMTNAVELTLSKVNYDFSSTSKDYKAGKLIVCADNDGKTLHLIIPEDSFDPIKGIYFKGARNYVNEAGDSFWMNNLGHGYFDQYYQFKKVE